MFLSGTVGKAFAAAHPYMGDIMQNIASADALEIGKTYGAYTNEMITSEKPYTWTLTFTNPVTNKNAAEATIDLTRSGILLLATIENLDVVRFIFTTNDENGEPVKHEITVDSAKAEEMTGKNVKEAGKTPSGLQETANRFNAISEELIALRQKTIETEIIG
jgi:hypothetical protein